MFSFSYCMLFVVYVSVFFAWYRWQNLFELSNNVLSIFPETKVVFTVHFYSFCNIDSWQAKKMYLWKQLLKLFFVLYYYMYEYKKKIISRFVTYNDCSGHIYILNKTNNYLMFLIFILFFEIKFLSTKISSLYQRTNRLYIGPTWNLLLTDWAISKYQKTVVAKFHWYTIFGSEK